MVDPAVNLHDTMVAAALRFALHGLPAADKITESSVEDGHLKIGCLLMSTFWCLFLLGVFFSEVSTV